MFVVGQRSGRGGTEMEMTKTRCVIFQPEMNKKWTTRCYFSYYVSVRGERNRILHNISIYLALGEISKSEVGVNTISHQL